MAAFRTHRKCVGDCFIRKVVQIVDSYESILAVGDLIPPFQEDDVYKSYFVGKWLCRDTTN
jgi:hypothetical protein